MKILHYSLGLPPYRSGGLTKYSHDLMEEQIKQGDIVYLLFPGCIGFINKTTKIKYYKKYKDIQVYEMINPLPVPLLNGIAEANEFCKEVDKNIFIDFLSKIEVDVVHIHTFMGLYKEFLEACKDMNIKVVYTTHDYFGICTSVNFINSEGNLCETRNIDKCIQCNSHAYSMNTIKILQSRLYRYSKNKGIISSLKKIINMLKKENEVESTVFQSLNCKKINKDYYIKLLIYYDSMYKLIDYFFFNSNLAKEIYSRYIETNGSIISITHSDIKDNRVIKKFDGNKLNLTYLGPYKDYKGFDLLINVMTELYDEGYTDITLNTYGDNKKINTCYKNININGRYSYRNLKEIFDHTDILIVPSIWNETFGFITLEALSYATPVLVTNKVGSKDLVKKFDESMIVDSSLDGLKEKIINVFEDRDILNKINKKVIDDKFIYTINNHYFDIRDAYRKVLEMK